MIEKFYADLLPQNYQHVVATINHKTKKITNYVVETNELIPFLSEINGSTYHSLGGYEGLEWLKTKDKKGKEVPLVKHDGRIFKLKDLPGCKSVKSWGFDLDIGTKETEYESLEGAASKLGELVDSEVIPSPTWVVSSGGGLQFYFTLEGDGVSEEQWVRTFNRLRRYLRSHLKFDPVVGSRPYKLFRSPCTENHKYRTPRPVEVIMQGPHVTLEWLDSLPDASEVATKAGKQKLNNKDPVPLKQVVVACPAMMREFRTRGENTPYDRWFATANICAHTYQGRKKFHVLSEGHPNYGAQETEDKYDEVLNNASDGPAGCEYFGNPDDPDSPCHGCAALKMGAKNPIHAVRLMFPSRKKNPTDEATDEGPDAEPEAELEQTEEELEEEVSTLTELTDQHKDYAGYLADKGFETTLDGYVWSNGESWCNKHGFVCDHFYFEPHHGDPRTGRGSVRLSRDNETFISLSTEQLSSPSQLASAAMGIGMRIIDDGLFARLVRYHTLGGEELVEQNSYGWTVDYKGALLPSGSAGTLVSAGIGIQTLDKKWSGQEGSWDSWLDAVSLYGKPGQEPYLMALLASLASPLMSYYVLERGVMYAMTGVGGAGKTSALEIATSVWGKPLKTLGSLSSTANAIRIYMKLCGNLPMVIDDITQMSAEEIKQLALQVSQGIGRERATVNLDLAQSEEWWLNFITTSNKSIHAKLAELVDLGTADMNRVVEVPIEMSKHVTQYQGQGMLDTVRRNYGHAGAKLIEHMLTLDRDAEIKAMRRFSEKLSKKDGLQGTDRFVRDLMLACHKAHVIMKQIDERFPGNPADHLTWMRVMLQDNNRHIADILDIRMPSIDDFITDYTVDGLILPRSSNGTYSGSGGSLKGYIFDEGQDSDWYLVPRETLEAWCRRNQLKSRTLLERWGRSTRLFNHSQDLSKKLWYGKLEHPIICDGNSLQPNILKVHKGHGHNAGSDTPDVERVDFATKHRRTG